MLPSGSLGRENVEHETGAHQRHRKRDQKGQKFLTSFVEFGEEGHVQLRVVIRGL